MVMNFKKIFILDFAFGVDEATISGSPILLLKKKRKCAWRHVIQTQLHAVCKWPEWFYGGCGQRGSEKWRRNQKQQESSDPLLIIIST